MRGLSRFLKQYLNIYWLRPITALWRTADALEISQLKSYPFKRPTLDLGCGDGMNSYILQGGKLGLEHDAFLSTMDIKARDFFQGKSDIYNFSEKPLPKAPPPKRAFDVGLDWKQDLLNKTAKFSVYKKLIRHDANNHLPFKDNSFKTIFSNTIYWIENVDGLLAELKRVLKNNGSLICLLPNHNLKDFFIYSLYLKNRWQWAKNFDMGRYFHTKHYYRAKDWKVKFKKAGLRVAYHQSYLSSRLIRISEIGLRPISPVLIKMANSLSGKKKQEIKKQWIEYCYYLSKPMFESGWLFDKKGPQTYHLFELKKAK